MTNRKDGGPAFPHCDYETIHGEQVVVATGLPGMSLRDYFAAAALTGIAADKGGYVSERANWAYKLADAMLEERDK